MIRRSLLWALAGASLLLASARPAAAQTTCTANCVVTVGDSFGVQFDHSGVNTVGYRLYLDGTKVGADVPVAQLQAGSLTFSAIVAPARGSHTLAVGAFNEDGETRSDAFTFTTKRPAPGKPTNIRLLITVSVAADGTVSIKVNGQAVPPQQH